VYPEDNKSNNLKNCCLKRQFSLLCFLFRTQSHSKTAPKTDLHVELLHFQTAFSEKKVINCLSDRKENVMAARLTYIPFCFH